MRDEVIESLHQQIRWDMFLAICLLLTYNNDNINNNNNNNYNNNYNNDNNNNSNNNNNNNNCSNDL